MKFGFGLPQIVHEEKTSNMNDFQILQFHERDAEGNKKQKTKKNSRIIQNSYPVLGF